MVLLREAYREVYVCSDVWRDIMFPELHARPIPEDIPVIMKAREEGWLKLRDIGTEEAKKIRDELIAQGFGAGESHSIALAKDLNAVFLANDRLAIGIARTYNIESKLFTDILHDALKMHHLKSIQEYVDVLDACIAKGLYDSKSDREEAINIAKAIERV